MVATTRDGFHHTPAILFGMLCGQGFTDSGREIRRQQLKCLTFVFYEVLQQLTLVVASQRDFGWAIDGGVS